jgi:hypothetical protein
VSGLLDFESWRKPRDISYQTLRSNLLLAISVVETPTVIRSFVEAPACFLFEMEEFTLGRAVGAREKARRNSPSVRIRRLVYLYALAMRFRCGGFRAVVVVVVSRCSGIPPANSGQLTMPV